MKHLLTAFACFWAMSLSAQSNQADCLSAYDGNGDGHINVNDLLGLLSFFDTQDLDGDCIEDGIDDCVCFEVVGCTNELACNYLSDATEDDGSCDFIITNLFEDDDAFLIGAPSVLNGCPDGIDLWDDNEFVLDHSEGAPTIVFSSDDEAYLLAEFGASSGAALLQILDNSTLSFCESTMTINNALYPLNPIPWNGSAFELQELFDVYFVPSGAAVGCGDSLACNFSPCFLTDSALCEYPLISYDCDGNCLADTDGDGVCDEFETFGCTDTLSCNYSEGATEEDGSCFYLDACGICGGSGYAEGTCDCDGNVLDECGVCGGEGIADGECDCDGSEPNAAYDCDGNCLTDTDSDGICDLFEVEGCTSSEASNYNPLATEDDGSCIIYGCPLPNACNYNPGSIDDGSCVFYCPGCTDETACNYDVEAIQENGSCEYPVDLFGADYFDCQGNCLNNADDDTYCDEEEVSGCMQEGACNYNPEATEEDESCEYESCAGCLYEFACNYDPEATIADNGSCEFGTCPGCTDPLACNYNPTVTEDDGSCEFIDACGICGGSGYAEGTCDCDGNVLDECGICGGEGIADGACDCDGNVLDECGVCGGDNSTCLDGCGVPNGDNSTCFTTCGDPISHDYYDYSTVQIGEQCWFAENLRSEYYANGNAIPLGLGSTTEGAQGFLYNNEVYLAVYGRLYNWYAVYDERGLCPNDWHVPTDGEWITLEMALGMSESVASEFGWRGTDQGAQMKSEPPSWDGDNLSGFSGMTGGMYAAGAYYFWNGVGNFWSSTAISGTYAIRRSLETDQDRVFRTDEATFNTGCSVRCLKDTE